MRFCVGERVVHCLGKGTVTGEFRWGRHALYHVLMDQTPPYHYNDGRPHVYALECQLNEDRDGSAPPAGRTNE